MAQIEAFPKQKLEQTRTIYLDETDNKVRIIDFDGSNITLNDYMKYKRLQKIKIPAQSLVIQRVINGIFIQRDGSTWIEMDEWLRLLGRIVFQNCELIQ